MSSTEGETRRDDFVDWFIDKETWLYIGSLADSLEYRDTGESISTGILHFHPDFLYKYI